MHALMIGPSFTNGGFGAMRSTSHTPPLLRGTVFEEHTSEAIRSPHGPTTFADPANTFHEKAMLCRAAENNCYFAAVNFASEGSATTSAVIAPDGTVMCYQPYGREGLLVADLDLSAASRLLATRYKPNEY